MKKIVYSGFYGFKNTGDDAFLEVAAWGSKKYLNADDVVFLGHDLPRLITESRELSKPLFKGYDRIQTFKELVNADYFISAGGSTFVNHKWHQLKEVALLAKQTMNRELKNGAIGVSIGPFATSSDEKSVQKYLQQIDFLTLRDRRSFEYVQSLNLPYQPIEAFDLAALLPFVYKDQTIIKTCSNRKIIGVSVCPYESISKKESISNEVRRNEEVVGLLQKLENESEDVLFRFFIMNGHPLFGDMKLTREVIEKSGVKNYEIIPYQKVVLDIWNLIGECNFMIATRLHAAIMAAYNNVPFILNEYHQKCRDFLLDVGQHEKLVVSDAQYLDFAIVDSILDIVENKNNALAPTNIDETQMRSLKNFNIAIK